VLNYKVFYVRLATNKVYGHCSRNSEIVFSIENFILYVQVHRSREGGILKSRLMAMRGELLKSPYLVELGALHLNLANGTDPSMSESELIGEFSCDFESSSPTLTCALVDSANLDFDLSCPICLVLNLTFGLLLLYPCPEFVSFISFGSSDTFFFFLKPHMNRCHYRRHCSIQ